MDHGIMDHASQSPALDDGHEWEPVHVTGRVDREGLGRQGGDQRGVQVHGRVGSHDRANAGATCQVPLDAAFLQCLHDAKLREAASTPSSEHQARGLPAQKACQPRPV